MVLTLVALVTLAQPVNRIDPVCQGWRDIEREARDVRAELQRIEHQLVRVQAERHDAQSACAWATGAFFAALLALAAIWLRAWYVVRLDTQLLKDAWAKVDHYRALFENTRDQLVSRSAAPTDSVEVLTAYTNGYLAGKAAAKGTPTPRAFNPEVD